MVTPVTPLIASLWKEGEQVLVKRDVIGKDEKEESNL